MTATEFEIENPEDPETARLVCDTENVEQILPELETLRSQMGGMGAPQTDSHGSGNGLVAALKGALGLGSGSNSYEEERAAAEELTHAYAQQLQTKLESNGRWETVCAVATES